MSMNPSVTTEHPATHDGPGAVAAAPAAPAPSRRRALVREWLPVTGLFFVLGCVITWPLVFHMSSGFFGFGNDNWGGIWNGWWIHHAFWGPEHTGFSREIEFPFGSQFDDRYIQPYDRVIDIVFGGIAGGTFAYNFMILASFPLAGVSMYALARYVTRSQPASIVAAVVFTASPFHTAMSMQYPPMASIHVAPLYVLALLVLLRRRRLRDAAWAGAALMLVWATSYYYGWFAIWFTIPVLVVVALAGVLRAARARRAVAALRDGARFVVTRGAVAGGVFGLLAIPLLYPLASKVLSHQETYARQEDDLYYTAVRPWQYLLPPHDNPIFGGLTHDVITRHLGTLPVYEQSNYLGVVGSVLALIALVGLVTVPRVRRRTPLPAVALTLGAIFCVVLTLGPVIPWEVTSIGDWLSPNTNPHFTGPVKFIYDLSPNFRYYGRAFVFVSCVLAVLAAVGFTVVARRLLRGRAPWMAWALAAVVSLLVCAEFVSSPPSRFVNLPAPPWVQAVRKLPDEAPIVEYPIADYSSPRSLQYIYWQGRHGHPTVNPPLTPKSQAFQRGIDDPESYLTGRTLSRVGVRYVVVHTKLGSPTFPPYQPSWPSDEMPRDAGSRNPWFRRVRATSDAVIYRVLPKARGNADYAVVGFSAGWGDLEQDPTGRWRWMRNDDSRMTIYSSTARRARLTFGVTSFNRPRVLRLTLGGRELVRETIQPNQITDVDVPLRLRRGQQEIHITTTPQAEIVDAVMHNGDRRRISVRIRQPSIVEEDNG